LPPLVIFRRKYLPKNKFLPGIVKVKKRWWVTEELILKWLNVNMAWKRQPGTLLQKLTMLVSGSFHGHMIER
jgi:hypothetical protein